MKIAAALVLVLAMNISTAEGQTRISVPMPSSLNTELLNAIRAGGVRANGNYIIEMNLDPAKFARQVHLPLLGRTIVLQDSIKEDTDYDPFTALGIQKENDSFQDRGKYALVKPSVQLASATRPARGLSPQMFLLRDNNTRIEVNVALPVLEQAFISYLSTNIEVQHKAHFQPSRETEVSFEYRLGPMSPIPGTAGPGDKRWRVLHHHMSAYSERFQRARIGNVGAEHARGRRP